MNEVLAVEQLHIAYGDKEAIKNLSFSIGAGKVLALVGESGSGKSTLLRSILRLSRGANVKGDIRFRGQSLLSLSDRDMRSMSGKDIAVIFQLPSNYFNPIRTIGAQYTDFLEAHGVKESREAQLDMLSRVGFDHPEQILSSYVSELSGGMVQRVAIAMAMTLRPALLLADEPTSALDAIRQEEILQLMKSLCEEFGTSVLFVTHNLRAASYVADQILILNAGEMVEWNDARSIVDRPEQAYTKLLWDALGELK